MINQKKIKKRLGALAAIIAGLASVSCGPKYLENHITGNEVARNTQPQMYASESISIKDVEIIYFKASEKSPLGFVLAPKSETKRAFIFGKKGGAVEMINEYAPLLEYQYRGVEIQQSSHSECHNSILSRNDVVTLAHENALNRLVRMGSIFKIHEENYYIGKRTGKTIETKVSLPLSIIKMIPGKTEIIEFGNDCHLEISGEVYIPRYVD